MKDFMLVFLGTNYDIMNLSPEEMQERMGKWFAWNDKMREAGVVKHGDALHSHGKLVSGPNRTVTDKNSTELKELIGGYYTVSARDYEHAIEIAQDYPDYDLGGTVEIREVMSFDQP